jgi:hypothetical protein
MSETAFTRLTDLLQLGYRVDAERSSGSSISLEHPGSAPNIMLTLDGTITAIGMPLWPPHFPYGFEIPSRDARLFGLWCQRIDEPRRFENFRFDVWRAVMTFSVCRWASRSLGVINWHLGDLRERLRAEHK